MEEKLLEVISLEISLLIRRVTHANRKIGHLDRSAYLLLHRIFSSGPAGVKDLADEFHLDISTVSRQTDSLERKGYVYRIPDPSDRRAYSLQITELGQQEFVEHQRQRLGVIGQILQDWTEEECHQFGQLLRKYNDSSNKGEISKTLKR